MKKQERIIAKGEDMTRTEVQYLLKRGFSKAQIARMVGMTPEYFKTLLNEWGVNNKGEFNKPPERRVSFHKKFTQQEKDKQTQRAYELYKYGMSMREISKYLNVNYSSMRKRIMEQKQNMEGIK